MFWGGGKQHECFEDAKEAELIFILDQIKLELIDLDLSIEDLLENKNLIYFLEKLRFLLEMYYQEKEIEEYDYD